MVKECNEEKDFSKIIEDSKARPVFLLKHSTVCPHSAMAMDRFMNFSENNNRADFWKVPVIEKRQLSLKIAGDTGVTHQSPQGLLFFDGKVIWKGYRSEINKDQMTDAMDKISL